MEGYVLKKEQQYIAIEPTGKIAKSTKQRTVFSTVQEATDILLRATAKTKGFTVQIYNPEIVSENAESVAIQDVAKRKTYSEDVRKLIYQHCNGRCKICGRPVSYNEMTLDHIVPLAAGGKEDVLNLQCTHMECNQAKGCLSNNRFLEMITSIFLYQMHKRYRNCREWKKALKSLLKIMKKQPPH